MLEPIQKRRKPAGSTRRDRLSLISKRGIPALRDAVEAGTLTVLRGFLIAHLPPTEQPAQLALWTDRARRRQEGSILAAQAIAGYLAKTEVVSLAELGQAIVVALRRDR